ncbi:flavin reductase [bacterium]|nr:flavin reductase [bacterium]
MDKKAMYKISYGLFVITTHKEDLDNGCITNTVAQVTSEPNQISVTINKTNFTHDLIMETGQFTASIISQEADFELFKHFGFQSGRSVNKFANFNDCQRSDNGDLYITKGTNAYISAEVVQKIDLGTHTLFIGKVSDMKVLSEVASATYDYYQGHIKPKKVGTTPTGKTIWRCRICGYEYVGEELPADFICPWCKHPASDFEKVTVSTEEAPKPAAKSSEKTIWRCPVCGYEYEGEELPEGFVCPLCSVPGEEFEKVN